MRCLVRDLSRRQGRAWFLLVEVVRGDLLNPNSLADAMRDVNVVDHLIHSLSEGGDFARLEVTAARNCSAAAKSAGVARIIYLGGLGDSSTDFVAALALAAGDRRGAP